MIWPSALRLSHPTWRFRPDFLSWDMHLLRKKRHEEVGPEHTQKTWLLQIWIGKRGTAATAACSCLQLLGNLE